MIQATTDFHGHWCPGLAIGIRAAEWALKEIGKAADEDIVAVVETDMCGVDAIQFLTGCTFGKGNLIHLDYGKNAFSFFRRSDGKAMRLVTHPDIFGDDRRELMAFQVRKQKQELTTEEEARWQQIRENMSDRVMSVPLDTLFTLKAPAGPAPGKARLLSSLVCDTCGEAVMESRTRRFQGKTLCIPCFEDLARRL
jgi:formylmethanofuran dehydrogenase subunit E